MTGAARPRSLTLLLGEERLDRGVQVTCSEDEIEQIAKEVAVLGSVPRGVRRDRCSTSSTTCGIAAEYVGARRRRLRAEAAREVARSPRWPSALLDRLVKSFESTAGFTALEKADPQQLSKFILAEHPQTIALILAHLERGAAPRSSSRCCPTSCAPTCSRGWPASTRSRRTSSRGSRPSSSSGCKTLGGAQPRAARRRSRRGRAVQPAGPRRQPVRCSRRSKADAPDLAVVDPQPDVRVRRPARTSTTAACARSSSAPTRRC